MKCCENFDSCKGCIELLLKFVFVTVFTYVVISAVCCMKSCSNSQTACCKASVTQTVKQCGPNCIKPCCAK